MNLTPPPKIPLENLLSLMQPEHKRVSEHLLKDYRDTIAVIPGSVSKHQSWEGGYISHIEEAMNIGIILYHQLKIRRPLSFSLSDLLFCIFLHDFDKVQRYQVTSAGIKRKTAYSKDFLHATRDLLLQKYNYALSEDEYKGIKYAHGEPESEYNPKFRVTNQLGALVHCCDYISARIWYDYGKLHDSWEA